MHVIDLIHEVEFLSNMNDQLHPVPLARQTLEVVEPHGPCASDDSIFSCLLQVTLNYLKPMEMCS